MSFDDVTEIVSLCGGGIAAVTYAEGVLYALHKSGRIIKTDASGNLTFNKEIVYTGSSGGMLPLMLLNGVINNELYKKRPDDWFEYYIIEIVSLISSSNMIQLYISTILKSIGIYNNSFAEIVRSSNQKIGQIILDTLPSEILNGKRYVFAKPGELSYFNYNYVIDSAFNASPMVSNDFTHLNDVPIHIQIAEAVAACCIAVSFSHLQNGILNDAALLVDNDILGLDNYKQLKCIYYYSLTAYDAITNNHYREHVFSLKNLEDRSSRIFNYRAINNLKIYCERKSECKDREKIEFKLIVVPNKYNPIRKYNNIIYNEVVPSMFFQCDFIEFVRFVGLYSGDLRMNQFMFLLGAYETLYVRGESQETANHITDALKPIYKETLDDAYNVYFKTDFISVIMRTIASSI